MMVAALVVSKSAIALTKIDPSGKPLTTVNALERVSWAPDAELRVLVGNGGVAVVWRGVRDKKNGRHLAILDHEGHARGEPGDVGASVCAIHDGLVWTQGGKPRSVVRFRGWDGGPVKDIAVPANEHAISLSCGERQAYLVTRGDDAISVAPVGAGGLGPTVVAWQGDELAGDDEQQFLLYTFGDDVGFLRVGEDGTITRRELQGGTLSRWRRLQYKLHEEDDVVAVDGDANGLTVVFTRDETGRCSDGAESAWAVHLNRASGHETVTKLASALCNRSLGPFWIDHVRGAPLVAWVERGRVDESHRANIHGLAYRSLAPSESETRRLVQPADAFTEVGCARDVCYAAALARELGQDGMSPEPIRLLPYP